MVLSSIHMEIEQLKNNHKETNRPSLTKLGLKCSNCGSEQFHLQYDFNVKTIMECDNCQLMVINPFPTTDELKQVYSDDYFSNKDLVKSNLDGIYGYVDYMYERLNKQGGYKTICEKISHYLGKQKDQEASLLDFGCGLGYFLDSAYDYGFAVHGVEFNEYALSAIKKRYAYPVKIFNAFDEFDKKFDAITMLDVIEHLEDPFTALDRINGKLNKGGILVVHTMDSKSFVSRLLGSRLEDFRRIREHLFFFSRKNLKQALEKRGFEILEIYFEGHTFEFKYLAQRIKTVSPLLGKLLDFSLKLFPFLSRLNIYINPRTKIILYARKS